MFSLISLYSTMAKYISNILLIAITGLAIIISGCTDGKDASTTQGNGSSQANNTTTRQISTTAPAVSIIATNNPNTPDPDLMIKHMGGDTLNGGDWRLSIVPAGNLPAFKTQSNDLSSGTSIIFTTTTEAATMLNNQGFNSGVPLTSGLYNVRLAHTPSNAVLLNGDVEVR